uniref:Otolin 1a n=1 Tax=Sinocyclocheilus anshuiensis TaxID=1608454 RepID=A0A671P5U3_9TELE
HQGGEGRSFPPPGLPIKFDKVIYNEEGHWDPHASKFNCTHGGVYVFSYYITVRNRPLRAALVVNGIRKLRTRDSLYGQDIDQASNMAVLRLSSGDQVWLETLRDWNGVYSSSEDDSTFSGFLESAPNSGDPFSSRNPLERKSSVRLEARFRGLKGLKGEPAVQKRSAFSIGLFPSRSFPPPGLPIKFDKVIYNEEGYWDPHASKFNCTHGGVYVFSYYITVRNRPLRAALVVNGIRKLRTRDSLYGQDIDQASNMAVLRLSSGDQVWLETLRDWNGVYSSSEDDSTFSGFLLYELPQKMTGCN